MVPSNNHFFGPGLKLGINIPNHLLDWIVFAPVFPQGMSEWTGSDSEIE